MVGKFIVLEGIDGSGKSTQAKLLEEYLTSKGIETYLTSEPTKGPIGNLIRAFIKDDTLGHQVNKEQFNKVMTYLFRADRIIHSTEIKRQISNGVWVICDRYEFSTLAYNGDSCFISGYENDNLMSDFLEPDLTIMVDVTVDEAIKRIGSRSGGKEVFENKEFLEKVSKNYELLDIFYKFQHINGLDSVDEVQNSIRLCVASKFGL